MKSTGFLLLLLESLRVFANLDFSRATHRILVGQWQPIKNLSDPHVLEIAQFAVSEHNFASGSNLGFIRVNKGWTQLVNGMNYRLVIEAKDEREVGSYEAFVFEQASGNSLKLASFKPLLYKM